MTPKRLLLFGGDSGWHSQDWTDSDDRVRGGKSQSYISCSKSQAEFYGTLDIQTLGGAGFASQRTTGDDRQWDLSDYDGVELSIAEIDEKQYTFILRDQILPLNPDNGREQSTISYEHEFKASSLSPNDQGVVFIPWKQFKATYRGKEKKDAPDLDIGKVKRLSLMMRSYFGSQEGTFSLTILSIAATSTPPSSGFKIGRSPKQSLEADSTNEIESIQDSKVRRDNERGGGQKGFLAWLVGNCVKL